MTKLTISILGDSISTYDGISNNPQYNETIICNKAFYKPPFKLEDTWWYQTIKELNYCLLVNNSFSGSSVSDIREEPLKGKSYLTRSVNLHNNDNINPDIILIYMGVNDLMDKASCNNIINDEYFKKIEKNNFIPSSKNFDESYALMIYKITKKYHNAKIYSLSIPKMGCNTNEDTIKYNKTISIICKHYGVRIIDLYNSNLSNYEKLTIDGVHPNIMGMKEMSNVVYNKIKKDEV